MSEQIIGHVGPEGIKPHKPKVKSVTGMLKKCFLRITDDSLAKAREKLEEEAILNKYLYAKGPELVDDSDLPMDSPVDDELEKASDEYVHSTLVGSPSVKKNAYKAGARWQKQQDEHTIWKLSSANYDKGYEKGKEEMKQKMIEWLKENVTYTHPRKGTKECLINISALKDAMND
jgi:hypothetical protein